MCKKLTKARNFMLEELSGPLKPWVVKETFWRIFDVDKFGKTETDQSFPAPFSLSMIDSKLTCRG